MNTAKIYRDSDGNECSIHQMVKREPYWAATRVQEGEVALEELAVLSRENADLKEQLKTERENKEQFERDWLEACDEIVSLKARLEDAYNTMNHAEVFITSREKMHKDGQELYRELLKEVDTFLDHHTEGSASQLKAQHYRKCAEKYADAKTDLEALSDFDGCGDEYCNWCGCLDRVRNKAEAILQKIPEPPKEEIDEAAL